MSLLLAPDPALAWPKKPLTSWHSPTPHPQTFVQAVPSAQATLALALPDPILEGRLECHPLQEACSDPLRPLHALHTQVTCSPPASS